MTVKPANRLALLSTTKKGILLTFGVTWGQILSRHWIFKNGSGLSSVHHLETHVQVHSHILHRRSMISTENKCIEA